MNKLFAHILGISLIATGFSVGTAGIAQMANANGILVQQAGSAESISRDWRSLGSTPRVQVFVNLPLHNAPANTYNKASVPFSYRIKWAVCDNAPFVTRVITRYDVNGGLHSNINGDGNTQWKQVSNEKYSTSQCGAEYCFATRNSNSTSINMSDVKGNHTTLQVIAKWAHPNAYISEPDSSIPQYGDSDSTVVNIHLHWAQVATPTPTPTPTPVPNYSFICTPANQTVNVNEKIGVYQGQTGKKFNATWSAPGSKVLSGNGTSFQTWYTTPGDKVITAKSIGLPGGEKTTTCKVHVVATPTPTPT
ncbi:MAG: hypothetical protein AAB649_01550, partial [Patescibacteria group bacterium]